MRTIVHTIILILVCSSVLLSGENPYELFERGNTLYKNGQYHEAVKIYNRILADGFVSAEVYFNLGNALYRTEQLAQAILAFERAARLKPNDPDIQHNLKLCYLKTIDRIEPLPELFLIQWLRAIVSLISQSTAEVLFLIFWTLFFLALSAGYFVRHPSVIRVLRFGIPLALLGILLAGFFILSHELLDTSANEAIITAHTVTAKSSPDPKSIDAFVIHEGLKVKITDSVGDWVKIVLPDGKVGWIDNKQCEKI